MNYEEDLRDDTGCGPNEDLLDCDVLIDGLNGFVLMAWLESGEWLYEVQFDNDDPKFLTEGELEEFIV